MEILRNKKKIQSNIKIHADSTLMQRQYLKEIQTQLRKLENDGITDKTIKFIDNIPKIVNKRPSKN